MPDAEYEDSVLLRLVAVQRKVTGLAAGYDQFSQPLLRKAPDERMISEDLNGFGDEIHRFQRGGGLGLQEEIGQSIKIRQRSHCIDYARQDFAFGLEAGLPCARSRR